MAKRRPSSPWPAFVHRNLAALTRMGVSAGSRSMASALAPLRTARKAPAGAGDWLAGMAFAPTGALRYRLFRPAGIGFGERLPLMVMLHGCGQDAKTFAASTRMNVVAARERFLVLYPEQDRLQRERLLELVRHALRTGRRRVGADHGGDRPGGPALRRRPRPGRGRRALRRRQHGGAAGDAPSRALQGGDDALRRRPRRRPLVALGGRRDAGSTQSGRPCRRAGRCGLAAADGDPGRAGRGRVASATAAPPRRSGPMRPARRPAQSAASSAASAIR